MAPMDHYANTAHLLLRRMTQIDMQSNPGPSLQRLKDVAKITAKNFVAMNTKHQLELTAFIGGIYPDVSEIKLFSKPEPGHGQRLAKPKPDSSEDQLKLQFKVLKQLADNTNELEKRLDAVLEGNEKILSTQKQEAARRKADSEAAEWEKDFSLLQVIEGGLLASCAADLLSRIAEAMGSEALTEQSIYDAMGKCTADYMAWGYDESMANYVTLFSFLWAWVAMSIFLVIRRQHAIEDKKISEKDSQTPMDLIWRTMNAIMTFVTLYTVATSPVGQLGRTALQYAADHLALTGTIQANFSAASGIMTAATFVIPFVQPQMLPRLPLLAELDNGIQLLDVARRICASGARSLITIMGKDKPKRKNKIDRINITVGGYSF